MSGFTVHLSDGAYIQFPEGDDMLPTVLEWYRDARSDQVITLNAANMTAHVQKRHITRIVSPESVQS